MANWTGTVNADSVTLANLTNGGKPPNNGVYNLNGQAGNDTFYLANNGNASYNRPFVNGGFTIGPAVNGVITVSGASSGGTHLTFNLTSVETLVFYDKTVTLSYATPDTTPPTVSAYSPATGATGVGVASNIVLTFSEAVQLGTGLIEVHSGSATGAVVATNTTETLTVSGNTLTINPTSDLASGTDYYVTLVQGSIQDLAGNGYSGTTAYHFSTASAAIVVPTTALPADGSSYTSPALAGVGILGILSWVLF